MIPRPAPTITPYFHVAAEVIARAPQDPYGRTRQSTHTGQNSSHRRVLYSKTRCYANSVWQTGPEEHAEAQSIRHPLDRHFAGTDLVTIQIP